LIIDLLHHPNRKKLIDERLQDFVESISRLSMFTDDKFLHWCFLDGTSCEACRWYHPENRLYQEICYDGMDREHCLALVLGCLPNGLIPFLIGPYEGRHTDIWGQDGSFLGNFLVVKIKFKSGRTTFAVFHSADSPFTQEASVYVNDEDISEVFDVCIYGDQGMLHTFRVRTPYARTMVRVFPNLRLLNHSMAKVRVEQEHLIHILKVLFPILKTQQSFVNRDMKSVITACCILTNISNCLRPNQVSQRFDVTPPSLDELFFGL
jgi:nuclease HARBI1